jgi:hypothetical protein
MIGTFWKRLDERKSFLKENKDWGLKMKKAVRPKIDVNHAFETKIFDLAETDRKGVTITNYTFLDAHPGLILF